MDKREALEKEILDRLEKMNGHVGFYYKNLATGKIIKYHADEQFSPASIVKLPLLCAMYLMKEKGETSFDETETITDEQKMPACGAVPHMTGNVTLDVRSLSRLMIVISDTTATNALFRHYGAERIGKATRELGLVGTQFNRAYFDDELEKAGINNYFVPTEIGELLEKIYNRTLISEEADAAIEDLLLHQQINGKMPAYLPMGYPIAHKTGEEEDKTHDVGIVFAKEPFIVCYASHNSDIPTYEDFMRSTTRKLVELTDPELEGYYPPAK